MNIATLWSKGIFGKLIVLVGASLACGLVGAVVGGPAPARTRVFIAPTLTPAVTAAPPTATPAPTVSDIARMICGQDYRETKYADGGATVYCAFDPQFNDETMAVGVLMDYKSLARRAWEIEPGLTYVRMQLITKMQDALGNENLQTTVDVSVSKALGEQINWGNLSHRALPGLLVENADNAVFWVHPVFQASFLKAAMNR